MRRGLFRISCSMNKSKYAYLSYRGCWNVGNDIQSMAVTRFLPSVDAFVDYSSLCPSHLGSRHKLFLNGWWFYPAVGRIPKMPPDENKLDTKLVGVHVEDANPFVRAFFERQTVAEWMQSRGPIGCRDLNTLDYFSGIGVDAYFSGCPTLTYTRRSDVPRQDYILLVSCPAEVSERVRAQTKRSVIEVDTDLDSDSPERNWLYASFYAGLYQAASCVITTRLHAAMPCLGFETPVLLLNTAPDFAARMSGLSGLTRVSSLEDFLADGKRRFNFDQPAENHGEYLAVRSQLIETCTAFTESDETHYKPHMAWEPAMVLEGNARDFYRRERQGSPPVKSPLPATAVVQLRGSENKSVSLLYRVQGSDGAVLKQVFAAKDYELRRLKRYGDIQNEYQRIVASGKRPLIIDCGANVGASAIYFAMQFPEARVCAIEPELANYEMLQINSWAFPAVHPVKAAVGSFAGVAAVVDPGLGDWGYRVDAGDGEGKLQVDVVTIEEIEELFVDGELFLVKVDIEGSEKDLFEKNTGWIERAMVLVVELHDWMLPKCGTSRNFLRVISGHDRDFVHFGENVFSVRN